MATTTATMAPTGAPAAAPTSGTTPTDVTVPVAVPVAGAGTVEVTLAGTSSISIADARPPFEDDGDRSARLAGAHFQWT